VEIFEEIGCSARGLYNIHGIADIPKLGDILLDGYDGKEE
jgi:hypothetical protein